MATMNQAQADRPLSAGVVVVGCGSWGRNIARCLAQMGALVAVADQQHDAAQAVARSHGVPAVSLRSALSGCGAAAVAIATPPESHAALVAEALAAGHHVFVEKPLTLDIGSARKLATQANAANRVLMTGHVLRYHPAFEALERLVAEGRLGRLLRIHASRLGPGAIRAREDAMWCLAPHDVSMVLALAGARPERVTASGEYLLRAEIADAATLQLGFAGGLAAMIQVSWLHPFKEQRLTVVGETAMAVFDDRLGWGEKLRIYPHRLVRGAQPAIRPAEPEALPLDEAEPLAAQCRHFLDCIATGRTPRTGPDEALAVMDVLSRGAAALTATQREFA